MAEYVRRKPPPADHPFWAHLNDRANPPSVVWPVAVPTAVGLVVGLAAGFSGQLSMRQAVGLATIISGTLAGAIVLFGSIVLVVFRLFRGPRTAEAWLSGLTAVMCIGFGAFLVVCVPLGLLLLWYSLSGGYGPWAGMAIGAGLGVGPGILAAWGKRHRWADRIRRWPRWETLRRRHRRQTAAAQPAVRPPTRVEVGPRQTTEEETVARPRQDQPGA